MWYGHLADLVVAVHVIYVGYVVVGLLVIWLGLVCKWSWIRNPWFRWTHLAAILLVAAEAALKIPCPLTEWEYNLRVLSGQTPEEGTFIGRLLHAVLFYHFPPWVFLILYFGFALLVLGTFVLAPPRWRRRDAHSMTLSAPGKPGG
jgi:Protein of Unknown function (DUF2784)